MNKLETISILIPMTLLLIACSESAPPASSVSSQGSTASFVTSAAPVPVSRNQDFSAVMRGAKVYQANCAACHGPQAEGAPNWQRQGPDGKFPAPPLNGTGHSWHHPHAWLRNQIMKGSLHRGGAMPGWEGKLSNEDIETVIAWIQSRWPDEIYQSWLVMDQKSRQANAKQ